MKLYLMSLAAVRSEVINGRQSPCFHHVPWPVFAQNDEDARRLALDHAEHLWPISAGWAGHSFFGEEMTLDALGAAIEAWTLELTSSATEAERIM